MNASPIKTIFSIYLGVSSECFVFSLDSFEKIGSERRGGEKTRTVVER